MRRLAIHKRAARVEKVADSCDKQPSRPDDVVSDQRIYYDGNETLGAAPVHGDATARTKAWFRLDERRTRLPHDRAGQLRRVRSSPRGPTTSTTPRPRSPTHPRPAPCDGDPERPTRSTGHDIDLRAGVGAATPRSVDPAGSHRHHYDPLGRKTQVWLPGRDARRDPNEVSYLVRIDGPNAITDKVLQADGELTPRRTNCTDGTGRARQTQTPASRGGRVIVDHIYDAKGLEVKTAGRTTTTPRPAPTC